LVYNKEDNVDVVINMEDMVELIIVTWNVKEIKDIIVEVLGLIKFSEL